MEKAFALVNIGDNQKVEYATYFPKGESNYWWETARSLGATEVITWDRFRRMFLVKYFPRYMQTQMEMKFFELKQENMTVGEYEKKFMELSRFVGKYVDSEEKRAKRFQPGLKPWIRSRVAAFELTTYAEVVQKAMVIEGKSEQSQKEKNNKKRRFVTGEEGSSHRSQNQRSNQRFRPQVGPKNFKKKEFGNRSQENRSQETSGQKPPQASVPECKICSKRHTGTCNKTNIVYFKCHTKGHYSHECKNQKANITYFNCGNVGHLSRECKGTGNNQLLQLTTAPYPVNQATPMSTPIIPMSSNQPQMVSSSAYPVLTYPAQARTFNMNMKDAIQSSDVVSGEFDVIIGMNWLTNFSAQIDYRNKKVVLSTPEGKRVTFNDHKQARTFLTSMQANKLIVKGCEAYLAYVVDKSKEVSNPEVISVKLDSIGEFFQTVKLHNQHSRAAKDLAQQELENKVTELVLREADELLEEYSPPSEIEESNKMAQEQNMWLKIIRKEDI
ncbi:hypothetical protein AgCh_005033 [Apium graveolens]